MNNENDSNGIKLEKSSCKLLIVDDVPRNIQIVCNILQEDEYDIYFANDGQSALDKVSENEFDLILLDIMMPGIDGFEVCNSIKSNSKTKEIPIIFLTAKTDTESIIKGFELGAVDYVTKPFNSAELLARVKTHLILKKTNEELKKEIEERRKAEKRLHLANEELIEMAKELNEWNKKLTSINFKNDELQKHFRQYTPRATWSHILKTYEQHSLRDTLSEIDVTMLFGDISKFTKFAEKFPAIEVLESINEIFQIVTSSVYKNDGDIDKFIGDAFFAVFDDPLKALKSAWEISKKIDLLNDDRMMSGKTPLYLRFGVNTGKVVRGDIGGSYRRDNTLIGDAVNLAQRLESSSFPGQILISKATYLLVKDKVKVSEEREINIKGRVKPTKAYFLENITVENKVS